MRKVFFIILVFYSTLLYSQDIILSEVVKQHYKLKEDIGNAYAKTFQDKNTIPNALKLFETSFKESNLDMCSWYTNYADLLAQTGDLKKAVTYYDMAFNTKTLTAEEFSYSYRKSYFEEDTTLYQKKQLEYTKKKEKQFTTREMELKQELKSMLAIDQLARKYENSYPSHKSCSKNIIIYTDSIVMDKIVELIKLYPEVNNILGLDIETFVIQRHIFTAYPLFWLTYFEPKERQNLINGNGSPQVYARTYDRCVITGKGEKSYYGEWDNDGKDKNPDEDKVNQRRANLGLPSLQEKSENDNIIFITY